MATPAPTEAQTTYSPKMIGAALGGIGLTLLLAALQGVLATLTPDTFRALGGFAPVAATLVGTGISTLVAYLKRDPLREKPPVVVVAPSPVVGDVDQNGLPVASELPSDYEPFDAPDPEPGRHAADPQ